MMQKCMKNGGKSTTNQDYSLIYLFKIRIKTEKAASVFSDAAFFYLSTVVYAKIEAMVLPISAGESTT